MAVRHTGDLNRFVGRLHKGDIVMCDTLHPLSRMIELAENRPVSHVALYVGDHHFIDCNTDRDRAVERVEAARCLGPRKIRTITAYRHNEIAKNPSLADDVVAVAEAAANDPAKYAFEALARITLPSLLRSYHDYLGKAEKKKLVRTFLNMSSVAQAVADQVLGSPAPGTSRLTCSAFVYRCFRQGGVNVKVQDALAEWDDQNQSKWRRGIGPVTPHKALERQPAWQLGLFLATRRARKVLKSYIDIDELSSSNGARPAPGDPVDTLITPRDLWGSPSFTPIQFLHRTRSLPYLDTDEVLDRA